MSTVPNPASQAPTVPQSAAAYFDRPLVLNPIEMIEYQRGQIRRKEYTLLGRLERIDLDEGCLPNTSPDNPLVGRWSARSKPMAPALDWLNQGPIVGLSNDEQDLLLVTHAIHPPPVAGPDWKRKATLAPMKYNGQIPVLEKPAMIEQSLLHRCWVGPGGKWARKGKKWMPDGEWFLPGTDEEQWMLFQPVQQMLLFLLSGGWGIVNCRADSNGRHTVFLYDRKREEGHILFGRKEMVRHVEVLRSA